MRWRMIDRITGFEEWRRCAGLKTASLEECSLSKRPGQRGILPCAVTIESCVELSRWLILRSSGFSATGWLAEVDSFAFFEPLFAGQTMELDVSVDSKDDRAVRCRCRASRGPSEVARGTLEVALGRTDTLIDPGYAEGLWKALHADS